MANPQIDTILRAYLAAAEAKKAAEAHYEALREELLAALDAEGLSRYTGAFAKLTVCERKNYTFPAEVVLQQEITKAQEKAAIKVGSAEVKYVTRFPRVTVTE